MASEDDPVLYGDEDDDEDSEEDLALLPNLDDEDDSTSSSHLPARDAPPSTAGEVTIAIAGVPDVGTRRIFESLPDPKRRRIEDVSIVTVVEEKKPLAMDESRKLFQRLWTDEDEIELLQGFLDYTKHRGTINSSHHLDTTAFYDQIKSKLQLDFNKSQLVEKLRRLKKKYRNVLNRIGSGKEYNFKSPHDQATFEISRRIWTEIAGHGGVVAEEAGFEDDESNRSPIPNIHSYDQNSNGLDLNSSEKKVPKSRKRLKIDEKHPFNPQPLNSVAATSVAVPNLIEETVKSCISPLFKELLQNATNGHCGSRSFANPVPVFYGGSLNSMNGDMVDERWRKQHILELEVYSKRLELVQDQIKSALEELKSIGG